MRRSWLVTFACCLAVGAVGSGHVQAQRNGPGPGPGSQNRIGFLGFEGSLGGKVVTGAPYSGQVTTEFTQALLNGNQIHRKTTSNVCRDSQGRTRSEVTLAAIFPESGNPPQAIFIGDPVAGVDYVLDPQHKTYRKFVRSAGRPRGGNSPLFQVFQGNRSNSEASADLGFQTIGGLSVQGTRITRVTPAHSRLGNEQPIQITIERWHSPELDIDVQTQTIDPTRGNTTTTVTNVDLNEPDSSLFQVPPGYTLQQPGGPFGRRPRAQGGTR